MTIFWQNNKTKQFWQNRFSSKKLLLAQLVRLFLVLSEIFSFSSEILSKIFTLMCSSLIELRRIFGAVIQTVLCGPKPNRTFYWSHLGLFPLSFDWHLIFFFIINRIDVWNGTSTTQTDTISAEAEEEALWKYARTTRVDEFDINYLCSTLFDVIYGCKSKLIWSPIIPC